MMSRHALSRRSLLRRLGTSAFLATPVFRNVLIEEARAAAPPRFVAIVFAGGARFTTAQQIEGTGTFSHTSHNFTWEKMLAPLVPYKNDLRVLKQIGDFTSKAGNGHTTLTLLTGDSRFGDEEDVKIAPGTTSLDQRIAETIGGQTRVRSLQLGLYTEVELARAHGRISLSNGAALAPVVDPKLAFARLFTGFSPSQTPATPGGQAPADVEAAAALDRLAARRRSVLDLRRREIEAIKRIAGKAESAKLDEHLTGIRELESRLPVGSGGASTDGSGTPPKAGGGCAVPALPGRVGESDTKLLFELMNEILYQAINCDLTRVATYQMLGSSDDAADFSFLGVNRGHHQMQHDPTDQFDIVQTWLMSQVAALIKRFKQTDEGGVSMLDNLGMLVVSEETDGREHTTVPTLGFLAGKAGGAIRPGSDLVGKQSSMNDLCLALGRAYGLTMDSFGEKQFMRSPLTLTT